MSALPKPDRRLPFKFNTLPDEAEQAIRRGLLKPRDGFILMFFLRRSRDGCRYAPLSECTIKELIKAYGSERGWSRRSIQLSLRRLKRWGFIAEEEDKGDVTGRRIVFPFIQERLRIVGGGGQNGASPGREELRPPGAGNCAPPQLLEARARSETNTLERENVNVGCADGETERLTPGRWGGAAVIEFPSGATAPPPAATDAPPAPDDQADDPTAGMSDDAVKARMAELKSLEDAQPSVMLKLPYLTERVKLRELLEARRNRRPGANRGGGGPCQPVAVDQARAAAPIVPSGSDRPPDMDTILRRLLRTSGYAGDAVGEAVEAIVSRLDDGHSRPRWRQVCDRVKRGIMPLGILKEAMDKAKTADSPRKASNAHIKEWENEHNIISRQ